MNRPRYDPLTDTIHDCVPYSFIWFHEEGHRNQFKRKWVRDVDFKIYKNRVLYFIWNQLLEIDANLYAIVHWIKFKIS